MAGFSTYLANRILDHTFGVASFAMPATVYVTIFSADPTDAGDTTNEATGGAYARQPVDMAAAAAAATASEVDVEFGAMVGSFNATHFGYFDAAAAGNMLYSEALTTPKTIPAGEPAIFRAGDLTAQLL